jgi:uncharacterized protein (TIGR02588 family)
LSTRKPSRTPAATTAERVALAISLALVAGVVGAVLVLWARGEKEPPRLRVEVGSAVAEGDGFRLPFEVVNDGGQTAAEVAVEGSIGEGASAERAITVFPFVPGRSRERGVLAFRGSPRVAQVRVTSYQEP